MKLRFLAIMGVVAGGLMLAGSAFCASAAEVPAVNPATGTAEAGVTLVRHGHPGFRGYRGGRHHYGHRRGGVYFYFGGPDYYDGSYSCYRRCRIYHSPRYCRYRCGW
jgi:hypothetical protein